MNRKPVSYSQHDKRWAKWPYQAEGEHDTISNSGCGPTCAAMLITTLTGKTFTPADACWWAREHGYKAKGGGTYLTYFEAQFKDQGLNCRMLRWSNAYHNPNHSNHREAMTLLKKGYYLIALMGPGNWTPGGHFVVVWWADNKIHINDPNSNRADRVNGDPATFINEVKYYWAIDAREYNGTMPKPEKPKPVPKPTPEKEEDIVTQNEFEAMFDTMMKKRRTNACSSWSREAREWAIHNQLIAGGAPVNGQPNYMWQDWPTREQLVQILHSQTKAQAQVIEQKIKDLLLELTGKEAD